MMLSIYEENPDASFGFVGANRIDESPNETKRYKVYSTIVATYFSNEFFFHKENKEKSAYLLINNRSLSNNPTLVKKIEDFFKNQYGYFDWNKSLDNLHLWGILPTLAEVNDKP